MSLNIIKQKGGAYIDSRDVAEYIGKSHNHLLRDIRGYCKIMEKANLSKVGQTDFFLENSYVDAIGRIYPCYLITKMGCELVANKLIGDKGVLFTIAYVTRFNEMEAAEREAEIKSYARPRLSEFNEAVKNVLGGMTYCFEKPLNVMNFLRGAYEPFGIKVLTERGRNEYLSATDIAKILHIYSETGRPHGHAVSAIISKLDNWENHAIVVPYGLVGIAVRYDRNLVNAVRDWITDNNFPREVPYRGFDYHIYYRLKKIIIDGEEFLIGGDRIDLDI